MANGNIVDTIAQAFEKGYYDSVVSLVEKLKNKADEIKKTLLKEAYSPVSVELSELEINIDDFNTGITNAVWHAVCELKNGKGVPKNGFWMYATKAVQ